MLPAVGVDRVRHQTVHGCGRAAVQTIREYRIDNRAFDEAMKWPGRFDRAGRRRGRSAHKRRTAGCGVRRRTRWRPRNPLHGDLSVARRRANDGLRDGVETWWPVRRATALETVERSAVTGQTARGCAKPLTIATPAHDHVAGEEAFVVAPLLLSLQRVGAGRQPAVVGPRSRRERAWLVHRRLSAPLVEDSQPVLVVAHTLGRRRRVGGVDGPRRFDRRFGSSREHDDPQDDDRQSHHDPGLRPAREHAAGRGALVGNRRGAGYVVGHGLPPLLKREAILAEREISTLNHLRNHVGSALHLEVDDCRLAVLHLVERRELAGV